MDSHEEALVEKMSDEVIAKSRANSKKLMKAIFAAIKTFPLDPVIRKKEMLAFVYQQMDEAFICGYELGVEHGDNMPRTMKNFSEKK